MSASYRNTILVRNLMFCNVKSLVVAPGYPNMRFPPCGQGGATATFLRHHHSPDFYRVWFKERLRASSAHHKLGEDKVFLTLK